MLSDDALRRETTLEVYEKLGRQGSHPPHGLTFATGEALARELGYCDADLTALPGSVLDAFVGAAALACEVPPPAQETERGWVLDLGCGAGLDSLILARRGHRALSLDGAPAMLRRLASSARELQPRNISVHPVRAFLPDLPLANGIATYALLNGVANLLPERAHLLAEIARVLRPAGLLLVADLLALGELPSEIRELPEAWAWCIAGAASPATWETDLAAAGFAKVEIRILEEIPPLGRALLRARKRD